jgi:exodeoxyribonuclease V beta subunit
VRDALADVGVPAVINGAGSVFTTVPADEWLRLLEALERPSSPPRARSVALTGFLGWNALQVADADDDAWEAVHRRLHAWARVLRERGVAALLETITLVEGLPARFLRMADGERRLTDLRHIGQLLHAAAVEEQLGVTALAGWLRRRMDEADRDTGDEDRSRRLESDAAAVQVLTIHRSKGLEFPIVHVPFLWEPAPEIREGRPVVFHDASAADARVVDVGLEGGDFAQHKRLAEAELAGEDLRLAYVALTRARHQAVLWWVGAWESFKGPLTRLLYGQEEQRRTPTDEHVRERLAVVADRAPGCIAIERSRLGPSVRWQPDDAPPGELAAAVFDRVLDHGWRRTSYSDMTAAAHDAWVASEPEEPAVADEPEPVEPSLAGESPFSQMPVGARIGTLVHRVFEEIDFTEPVDPAALPEELGDVAQALQGVLDADLGGWRLSQLSRADRLDELTFELPLAGGERPVGEVTPRAIGALLREHLPVGDPLAPYADRLDDPSLRRAVRGYLTGSIDLVARVDGRYVIADYKTNWLAGPDEPLTLWHHRPEALAEEMRRAHYGLQALLYTVALHRYLRWRLPGYSPAEHLGGVLYLFIRGMPGAGVFRWDPPAALVEALSDLLETG